MTTDRLRLLVCTTVHVPEDARILHRQIAALLDAGHAVTYAAPWRGYDTAPPDRDGLTAVDLPRSVGRSRLGGIRAARRLLRRAADGHDLAVVHDPELLLAVAGQRRRLPPVVWDVHEDTAASLGDRPWVPGWLRPAGAALARGAERWAEQRLHLILAEAGYRDRFRRDHPVVPNYPWLPDTPAEGGTDRAPDGAADRPVGDPVGPHDSVGPSGAADRDDAAVPDGDRVVHVGRLSRGRGVDELIGVGRRLAEEGITVELIGPADPEVTPALEAAHAAGAVTWHGFLPNPEAMGRIPGALAGLSLLHDEPNYRVSLPTKVLEYLSRSTPVVTTPLPAAERIVAGHDAGRIVPFGDAGAAAAAVLELRDDPAARRAMGRRGRAAVAAEYCWDVAGPRFVAHLERWARPVGA